MPAPIGAMSATPDRGSRAADALDTDTPELPPETWVVVARAALAAEGDCLAARARLSLVARAWRDGLRGTHCLA